MSESDSFEGGELKDCVGEEVNRRSALLAALGIFSPCSFKSFKNIVMVSKKKKAVLKKFQIKSC